MPTLEGATCNGVPGLQESPLSTLSISSSSSISSPPFGAQAKANSTSLTFISPVLGRDNDDRADVDEQVIFVHTLTPPAIILSSCSRAPDFWSDIELQLEAPNAEPGSNSRVEMDVLVEDLVES